MNTTSLIEVGLRHARCSQELAVGMLSVIMIAYLNEVDAMARKTSKKIESRRQPGNGESPAESFHRLAQGRTNKAVKSIGLIAQLTGSAYESTDVQRRAIVEALQAAVDVVRDTYEGKAKASDKFRLPSG